MKRFPDAGQWIWPSQRIRTYMLSDLTQTFPTHWFTYIIYILLGELRARSEILALFWFTSFSFKNATAFMSRFETFRAILLRVWVLSFFWYRDVRICCGLQLKGFPEDFWDSYILITSLPRYILKPFTVSNFSVPFIFSCSTWSFYFVQRFAICEIRHQLQGFRHRFHI